MTLGRPDPDALARRLAELDPQLDELSTARVEARLLTQLRAAQTPHPSTESNAPTSWRPGFHLWASVAAAALCLGLAGGWIALELSRIGHTPQASTQSSPPGLTSPESKSTSPERDKSSTTTPVQLVPYMLAGPQAANYAALLGQAQKSLNLPQDLLLRASLGPRIRLTLDAGAQLSSVYAGPQSTVLRLDEGTVVVSYDGDGTHTLELHTPDAHVRVVGTVFLVQAQHGHTEVAVLKGIVALSAAGQTTRVTSNQQATTRYGPPHVRLAVQEAAMHALQEHHRAPGPSSGLSTPSGTDSKPDYFTQLRQGQGNTQILTLMPREGTTGAETQRLNDSGSDSGTPNVEDRAPQQGRQAPARHRQVDIAALYARAEACMAVSDERCTRRLLRAVLRRAPDSAEASMAAYELAQLELATGHPQQALRHLGRVAQDAPHALRQSARLLECTHSLHPAPNDELQCYLGFLREFPASYLRTRALGKAVGLALEIGDCDTLHLAFGPSYPHPEELPAHARQALAACGQPNTN